MNQKEIRELIDYLIEKDIAEFELERGDVKLRIRRGAALQFAPPQPIVQAPQVSAQPVTEAASPAQSATATPAKRPAEEEGLHIVRSPIVGTYYEAPAPGAPPFVKVGDSVTAGQVVGIIEAMKLMNEIEADAAGEIAKIMVKNGQPVEYGQPMFAIRAV
jgi:acetyl-CoA carboxylase biotin carboxyl carrier protein